MQSLAESSAVAIPQDVVAAQWARSPVGVVRHPGLSDGEVRLYNAIALRINFQTQSGVASWRELAADLNVCWRTIARRQAGLVRAGLIRVERQYDDRGNLLPNRYHLPHSKPFRPPDSGVRGDFRSVPAKDFRPPDTIVRAKDQIRRSEKRRAPRAAYRPNTKGATNCDHEPKCAGRHACIERVLADARRDRDRCRDDYQAPVAIQGAPS
jgi:hypothetical protein